jgi:hypothetical protein
MDSYCAIDEATKAENAATFWDCIDGQHYGTTLVVAKKLVAQGKFETVEDAWVEAEAMCHREDAYKEINKQVDEYYSYDYAW